MTSCTLTASLSQPAMMCDRMELDAARALLGVSPSTGSSSSSAAARGPTSSIYSAALQVEALDRATREVEQQQQQQQQGQQHHEDEQLHWRTTGRDRDDQQQQQQQPTNGLYEHRHGIRLEESPENEMHTAIAYKRPRSDSAGLDALAALATKETSLRSDSPLAPFLVSNSNLSSEDSDADACSDNDEGMPPPPPRRRRRSASNPEGMEKWDSLKRNHKLSTGRLHFVLPAAILEEELQAVSAAMQERELAGLSNGNGAAANIPRSIPEDEELAEKSSSNGDGKEEEEEVDEASLTPEELLRRARSRLLEDLSEGSVNGEKGVMTLPHSLSKYKEVYNKNGRIGIYTPAERAAIIAKFNSKRTRRVWNKKIRYNCRKSLADRRLRVKGRFVKRSEQEQMAKELAKSAAKNDNSGAQQEEDDDEDNENDADKAEDEHMPDVNDPEAGFSPTEDQPYRRLRRHTIT